MQDTLTTERNEVALLVFLRFLYFQDDQNLISQEAQHMPRT